MNIKIHIKHSDGSARELLVPLDSISEILIKTVPTDLQATEQHSVIILERDIPTWTDICMHGFVNYKGTILYNGIHHDIYVFKNQDGLCVCARYGSKPEDYEGFGDIKNFELVDHDSQTRTGAVKQFLKQKQLI